MGALGDCSLAVGGHLSPEAPLPVKAWIAGQTGNRGRVRWGLQASANLGALAAGAAHGTADLASGTRSLFNAPTSGAHAPIPMAMATSGRRAGQGPK